MQVTLRLFAGAREAVGASLVSVSINSGASAREVVNVVVADHPDLARIASIARIAVNLEYVPDTTMVNENDEVALIPPVSGG